MGVPTSYIILASVAAAVALGLGVIIGHFSRSMPQGPCLGNSVPSNIVSDIDPTITSQMRAEVSAQEIRANLESYTRMPHVGGQEGSHILADEIEAKWREFGMDLVEQTTYNVLLSYPDEDNPNLIKLFNNGVEEYVTAENEIIPGEDNTGVIQPYNSHSPSGQFTGDMLYVNYCTREDFEELVRMGIEITGHLVICRYGGIFRGTKVTIAASYNATGVILYSDPKDYAAEGVDKVYPDTWWLPPTGVQRGTVYDSNGDPLTPGYPSTDSAYRLEIENAAGLPTLPSHPIGYGDAQHLLRALGGDNVPAAWQGGLNFTYRIGPLQTGRSVEMTVNNRFTPADAVNVIGYITGSVEPDRYVIIGGHRDAWAYGALDPNTGTAVTVEVARILSKYKQNGWRPRRTIVFTSWGAEEFGLMGSYEWVEQNVKKLSERAVAYMNLDTVVKGNYTLSMSALPMMNDISIETSKSVETPNQAGKSMFQEWLEATPDPEDGTKPRVGLLGSGSDHAPFFIFAGVPSVDIGGYNFDTVAWGVTGYPVYHSGIETFKIFETFIDPDFKYMQAVARYALEMLVRLSDSYVIPYNIIDYGDAVLKAQDEFETGYGDLLIDNDINLDAFKAAGQAFKQECETFMGRMETINRNNPVEVRSYNDAMMNLERAFLDPEGLPGRPLFRHVIFAPSSADSYSGSAFPGLTDALYQIGDDQERWEIFKRHLATVTFILQGAAQNLQEFHDI